MEVNTNNKLEGFINNLESEFLKVQENKELSFKQEAYFAIQVLQKNDYTMNIARTNPTSLRSAVINIATTGLSLNPSMGLAYLIPRKNEICADISYLGLIKLAQDSGSIKDVKAELVFKKDNFFINGAFKEPTHTYSPFEDRGELVGAYVVATTPENSFLTTIMSIAEILEIRDSSESYKNEKTRRYSPWTNHTGEMIKKTVIRRAYKMWPKTNKTKTLEKAIIVSDEAQAIEFKTEYQKEQEQLEKDFPIPPEEKELGASTYRIQNAKYRGKQLKDIDCEELSGYLETLDKRHEKHPPKSWELEVKLSIFEYLNSIEKEAKEIVG
jgi:recombination protein RecT